MRPNDVPSWKECVKRAWLLWRYQLWIIPGTVVIPIFITYTFLEKPVTGSDPAVIQAYEYVDSLWKIMPFMGLFLWLFLFLIGVIMERISDTPLEMEAKEKALLSKLKNKYPE